VNSVAQGSLTERFQGRTSSPEVVAPRQTTVALATAPKETIARRRAAELSFVGVSRPDLQQAPKQSQLQLCPAAEDSRTIPEVMPSRGVEATAVPPRPSISPETVGGHAISGRRESRLQCRLQRAIQKAHAVTEDIQKDTQSSFQAPGKAADCNGLGEYDCEGRLVTREEHDKWSSVFKDLLHDGEIHAGDLVKALERCGFDDLRDAIVLEVRTELTRYASLNLEEFVRFICRYEARLHHNYQLEFQLMAGSASGISVEQLAQLCEKIGLQPRRCALDELIREVCTCAPETLVFEDFARITELLRAREGFMRQELDEFRRIFQKCDRDASNDMNACELAHVLAWLNFPASSEKARDILQQGDIDGSGSLSEVEFLRCLRRIYEEEAANIRTFLCPKTSDGSGNFSGATLQNFLGSLGYTASTEAILDAAQDAGLHVESGLFTKFAFQGNFQAMMFGFSFDELCALVATIRAREGFTHTEMADFGDIFDSCKPAGREDMATPAISKSLRFVGHPFAFDVVQHLVAQVDVDGHSRLDFTMFVKLIRKCRDRELKQALAAFGRFDPLSTGVLDHSQQQAAFQCVGCVDLNGHPPPRTPEECAALSPQGFVKVVRRFRNERVSSLRENAGFTEAEMQNLRAVFAKFDSDGDNDITRRELARLIEIVLPAHAHAPEWRPYLMELLSEVDADGSGSLNFSEFVGLMRKIYDQEDEFQRLSEAKTIHELGFSGQEANKFRELFLDVVPDELCKISFNEMRTMLARLHRFTSKRCEESDLRHIFTQVVGSYDPCVVPRVSFLEFLRIMRLVATATDRAN
jgi:Ca2+-binding EF-hand superfamily protein